MIFHSDLIGESFCTKIMILNSDLILESFCTKKYDFFHSKFTWESLYTKNTIFHLDLIRDSFSTNIRSFYSDLTLESFCTKNLVFIFFPSILRDCMHTILDLRYCVNRHVFMMRKTNRCLDKSKRDGIEHTMLRSPMKFKDRESSWLLVKSMIRLSTQ